MKRVSLAIVLLLFASVSYAQTLARSFRVANLATARVEGRMSLFPPSFAVGGRLVFADGGNVDSSLWSTDGSESGLVQITDGILPRYFAEMGGILYFLANPDAGPRYGLWRTDGTRSGTWLLRDFFDGSAEIHNAPAMAAVGNQLFFFGWDPEHGQELWKTDGTASGTGFVADLTPGPGTSAVAEMVSFHDEVYFTALTTEPTYRVGLWRSDGIVATFVADVDPYHRMLGATNQYVFYTVADTELWRTDGTDTGTIRLKTFVEESAGSVDPYVRQGPSDFLDLNGTALFVANDGTTGRELWRSDGTPEGTVLVRDVHPGDAGVLAEISQLTKAGDRAYFSADDGVHGQEIWVTDATTAGTKMVRDVYPGSHSSGASGFLVPESGALRGLVFFAADDGVHGNELWRSDGTEEGTVLISDIEPGAASSNPFLFQELGDDVYFGHRVGDGWPLWKTDGTEAGTSRVDNSSRDAGSYPMGMTDVDGTAFFVTADVPFTTETLWRSDGTEEGTRPVRDICSISRDLHAFRGDLYFIANDCPGTLQVWTPNGPLTEIPNGSVRELVALDDSLFFWNEGEHGGELWRSDGTSDGTLLLRAGLNWSSGPPDPLVVALPNGLKYFVTLGNPQGNPRMDQLWRTDGTPQGTEPFVSPGPLIGRPVVIGNRLVFGVDEAPSSSIWTSDGTEQGTKRVTGFAGYPSSLGVLTVSGALAYFVDVMAKELWRTDGTAAGTVRVAAAVEATALTDVNGVLFFLGNDGVHGQELWASDGSPEGTRMVRDIWPGPIGSSATSLRNIDGILVFAARDGVHGNEPWRSDGTESGTFMLADVNPGIGSSDPSDFCRSGDLIFFSADDGVTGMELWAIPTSALSKVQGPRHRSTHIVEPRP